MKAKYFVLKPRGKNSADPYAMASRYAMETYAFTIEPYDLQLARELVEWLKHEKKIRNKVGDSPT